ncbi:nitrilase-related carbon-nitrogen hydrolase, partial [Mesorhizobium sp.]|uniref:nitrilase-related carbon-nitrogen hydrolase n=1 Tax=Mesorhizobium sp. TaxID=1871066 RepID=UPI0025810620
MPQTVIATCAFPGTYDIDKNVDLHLSYIKEAASAGASLVVFPETSLQGYPSILGDIEKVEDAITKAQRIAESVPDGPTVQRLITAAIKHNIHV